MEEVEKILEKVDKMQKLQEEIDKKTRDAEAYKQSNEWLVNLMKNAVISFAALVAIIIMCIAYAVVNVSQQYFDYESGIVREHVVEKANINTGENGIVINRSDNNNVENGGK